MGKVGRGTGHGAVYGGLPPVNLGSDDGRAADLQYMGRLRPGRDRNMQSLIS
jgi:hypothetical protein